MLDRNISKNQWRRLFIFLIAASVLILAIAVAKFYSRSSIKSIQLVHDKVTISEIKKGSFQEVISINGIVIPLAAVYLDASEGGRVDEIFANDGSFIKQGQPILKLSNTDLQLSLANQETAVLNVLTRMQNIRDDSDQNTIKQFNHLAGVENSLTEAERIYKLNKYLFEEKAIGSQELKSHENNYKYQLQRLSLTRETLRKDSSTVRKQLNQMGKTYARMQNDLTQLRRKVSDLTIRAPVDGQLSLLDAEPGQPKSRGERLGQIDLISGYKIRAELDRNYLPMVAEGLKGTLTLDDVNYQLRVRKVYPRLVNGRFQIDLGFEEKVPAKISKGRKLTIQLMLGEESQTVLLPRGKFVQQAGASWIYKVSNDGSTALKTDVQLGRQNPDFIEVIDGLEPGDRVITSSYEKYGGHQQLILKIMK